MNTIFILFLFIYLTDCKKLFNSSHPVRDLTTINFSNIVYHSNKIWVVNFYISWCGHCQSFAPTYIDLGRHIKDWLPVVELGAVSCGDDQQLCNLHSVIQFPTIKIFRPKSSGIHNGEIMTKAHSEMMVTTILTYLDSYVNISTDQIPSNWPVLKLISEPKEIMESIRLMPFDNQQVYLVDIENDIQFDGLKAILDSISLRPKIFLFRILPNKMANFNPNFMPDFPQGFLYRYHVSNRKSQVVLLETFNANSLVYHLKQAFYDGKYSTEIFTMAPSTTERPYVYRPIHNLDIRDLESNLHYTLWIEVAAHNSLDSQQLSALSDYIGVLAKYHPGNPATKFFLSNLHAALTTNNMITYTNFSSQSWLSLLDSINDVYINRRRFSNKRQIADNSLEGNIVSRNWGKYRNKREIQKREITKEANWYSCKESALGGSARGYPCSLWMTFHTLTVQAYITANQSGIEVDGLREVLLPIRNYVINFFACRVCSHHFEKETQMWVKPTQLKENINNIYNFENSPSQGRIVKRNSNQYPRNPTFENNNKIDNNNNINIDNIKINHNNIYSRNNIYVDNSSLKFSASESVLSLWEIHNSVNLRLHKEGQEDWGFPKVQFPAYDDCRVCKSESWLMSHRNSKENKNVGVFNSQKIDWNSEWVLRYLVDYYSFKNTKSYSNTHSLSSVTKLLNYATPILNMSTLIITQKLLFLSGKATLTSMNKSISITKNNSQSTCPLMIGQWGACSKTCDTGISVRVTNQNAECRMLIEQRLCMIRPCNMRFPNMIKNDSSTHDCLTTGHTYRLKKAVSLFYQQCRTVYPQRLKVCGLCPRNYGNEIVNASFTSQNLICCKPARSKTVWLELECRLDNDNYGKSRGRRIVKSLTHSISLPIKSIIRNSTNENKLITIPFKSNRMNEGDTNNLLTRYPMRRPSEAAIMRNKVNKYILLTNSIRPIMNRMTMIKRDIIGKNASVINLRRLTRRPRNNKTNEIDKINSLTNFGRLVRSLTPQIYRISKIIQVTNSLIRHLTRNPQNRASSIENKVSVNNSNVDGQQFLRKWMLVEVVDYCHCYQC